MYAKNLLNDGIKVGEIRAMKIIISEDSIKSHKLFTQSILFLRVYRKFPKSPLKDGQHIILPLYLHCDVL